MREIKFRAWDSVGCDWLHSFKSLGGFSLFGEVIRFDDWIPFRLGDEGRIIVEQFTGLYDENGKEIYEGDIVCNYNGYCEVIGNIHENQDLLEK